MSEGWQLRPAGQDDLPVMVEIFRAEDLAHRGRTDLDLTTLREQIAADGRFNPDRDMVLAEADGQAVALATISRQGANIAVHPDHEDPQLRHALLAWCEHRQTELGRDRFRIGVSSQNTPAQAMAAAAGYEIDRFYASMIRDFDRTGPPEPAVMPAGYRLRPVDHAGDVEALHALNEHAFSERPDHLVETLEEYDKRHIASTNFAPGWSLIAQTDRGEAAGSVVGSLFRLEPHIGYISLIAVEPAHRRRGLARNLLLAAFAEIHSAGLSHAELHVASDNAKAMEVYLGVGMSESERFDDYARTPG